MLCSIEHSVFTYYLNITHQSIILYPTETVLSNHHATIYTGD